MDILEKINNIINEYGDGHFHMAKGGKTGPPIMTNNYSHFHRLVNVVSETGSDIPSDNGMGHYHVYDGGITGLNETN